MPQAPGIAALDHVGQRLARVDAARVDGQAGGRQRQAVFALSQAERLAHVGHQILRVGAVQHREAARQADAWRFFTQEPRSHAVEGAAPRQRGWRGARRHAQRLVQQPRRAARHLTGGAARKGQQQHPLRVCTLLHQPGQA